jgi:DNA polymerase-3 subunit gamma/tau
MAIYNDWRPQEFSDVLGQNNTIKILKSQVVTGHFHHSYLFHGASGSGKTSTARLLASALNCDNPAAGEPCGICNNCRLVQAGHHWDTIEIDAARFRGIDDVKELCYKAQFTPIGKHKVYILDEVHSLTEQAFNCLLKLLEEPPSYVVLIMCTTEFNKIPDTIKSRCQTYEFKPITDNLIKCKLSRICQHLQIQLSPEHYNMICAHAKGNLRKAENKLEQCVQLAGVN